MKLNEIINVRPALEKIAGMEMDGAQALKFAKFTKDVLMPLQDFEVKRAELFRKFGAEEGEGDQRNIKILPENEKKFNAAIKRALDKEIKVGPFDITKLGIKISPAELVNALGLFK